MYTIEPVHKVNVEQDKTPQTRVGAVLIFQGEASRERCQQFLDRLYERGIIDEPTTAQEYDAHTGGPVWYIP